MLLTWYRGLAGALLFFLLELLERPISMATYLIWSRLRKRLGLVTGARRDQRENEQAHYENDSLTLLHTAPAMIHLSPSPSGDVHSVIQMRCAKNRSHNVGPSIR